MNKQSAENKVSSAILQKGVDVQIGPKTYKVAPPSIATLILVSEKISELPTRQLDSTNVASECLSVARECKAIGDIIAILILGAKFLKRERVKSKWSFLRIETIDSQKVLAKQILEELTPKELRELLSELLAGLELSFFFGITTSLIEINLLRPTKTIASGQ